MVVATRLELVTSPMSRERATNCANRPICGYIEIAIGRAASQVLDKNLEPRLEKVLWLHTFCPILELIHGSA